MEHEQRLRMIFERYGLHCEADIRIGSRTLLQELVSYIYRAEEAAALEESCGPPGEQCE